MVDPDGGVGEDHARVRARRRRIRLRRFSVPPSSASRRAFSRRINTSSPVRTRAVLSAIPVSFAARSSNASSMISVVCICINRAYRGISVKRNVSALSAAHQVPVRPLTSARPWSTEALLSHRSGAEDAVDETNSLHYTLEK